MKPSPPPRHLNSIVQKWALVGPHLTPITKTTILLHLRESSKVIYMCQIGQVYLSADEKEVTVGGGARWRRRKGESVMSTRRWNNRTLKLG